MAEMAAFAHAPSEARVRPRSDTVPAPAPAPVSPTSHLEALAARFREQAQRTKRAINQRFWDPVQGAYRASSGTEASRVDVWGTALAAFLNV